MNVRFLVSGASGSVGRHVAAQLRDAGAEVRALTRETATASLPEGVEPVEGDLATTDGLDEAMRGVEGLFLFPADQGTESALQVARRAGVRRVAVLSSLTVVDRRGGDFIAEYHRRAESAAERSGLEWTHIRPSEFAGTALRRWGRSISAEGIARAPYARAVRVPIHEADIAAVAVEALLSGRHAGTARAVTGPERMTSPDQVRVLSEVLGIDIRFEELDPAQGRAQFAEYVPAHLVDSVLRYMRNTVDAPMDVLPTVLEVTGRPPLTFAQWAADHAGDFLGSPTHSSAGAIR